MFLDVLDTTRLELCLVIFDRRQISLIFTAHYSKKMGNSHHIDLHE